MHLVCKVALESTLIDAGCRVLDLLIKFVVKALLSLLAQSSISESLGALMFYSDVRAPRFIIGI